MRRQWSAGGSSTASAAAAREDAELQEAIQLSLALEESRRQHEAGCQRAEQEAAQQAVRRMLSLCVRPQSPVCLTVAGAGGERPRARG